MPVRNETHFNKVCGTTVIVESSHIEASASALPSQTTDQAQHGRLSAEAKVEDACEALNGEDEEACAIKVGSHGGWERGAEVEERGDEVRVPQERRTRSLLRLFACGGSGGAVMVSLDASFEPSREVEGALSAAE